MKKSLKKLMAVLTAMSMSMSLLSFQALAAETNGTIEVESLPGGGKEVVDVVISIDGDTKTTETAEGGDVTESGLNVKYEGTETKDANGFVNAESSYQVINGEGTYGAAGGSEITTEKGEGASDITVKVPLTSEDGKNQNTFEKVETEVTGDPKDPENPNDGEYDYTTTTTSSQVSVTTNKITVIETQTVVDEEGNVIIGSDLDYVKGTVTPQGGENENDLVYFVNPNHPVPDGTIPEHDSTQWSYVYEGSSVTSQYWPAFVTTEKPSWDEAAEPVYVDAAGKEYYLYKAFGNTSQLVQGSFDSVYINGVETPVDADHEVEIEGIYVIKNTGYGTAGPNQDVTVTGRVPTTWAMPQQFVLVDMATGEKLTTYCADFSTPTQLGYFYNIENIEDADYYSEEEAAMIRSIAANGYWGVQGTEIDEEGNVVPKSGSLEAMKQMLLESGEFDEKDVALLTDGLALTATQMAIWSYSNKMDGIEFINTNYCKDSYKSQGKENTIISTNGASALNSSNPDAAEGSNRDASVDLLFKVYEYLRNLEPTSFEGNKTTADTIINADNFLGDMSLTVVEKAADHANNQDADDTNDAYVTELTFALVVTPSTENGDDLVVKVVDADGNVLASGRVAGEAKEGENVLTADENGNYTLSNITMVEGNTNFNISLEGVQNLKEGVYLYTSEVVEGTSSQTMVGIATGEYAVSVSMNLEFNLSVEDEVVVTERVWRTEWTQSNPPSGGENPPSGGENPPSGGENPPSGGENSNGGDSFIDIIDEGVPMAPAGEVEEEEGAVVDMIDEEIPLADVPKTGDASALWMMMSILSGTGLAGVSILGRKKREE